MSMTSTKENLLHEASRMLLAKGLNGFSLQELADKLKIKKASLFHHYPSKTNLAIELYRYYLESFNEWTKSHEAYPPEKQITLYAQKLTDWICLKNRVCPVGTLSLEWNNVGPALQKEILKLHQAHKKWLQKMFKEMNIKISVSDAVMTTMALIQGSIQLARINNDTKLVNKNLKIFLESIK